MKATYEVRHNDNPHAMPLGTYTASTHATIELAAAAIERERAEFAASPYGGGGSYLPRIIVRVSAAGEERVFPADAGE